MVQTWRNIVNNDTMIQHFGVWIKKAPTLNISRDTYAVIDKKSSTWTPRISELRCYKNAEDRRKIFDDDECKIYSDDWCKKHREKCLLNFDLNMLFFAKLKKEKFESCIEKLLSSNKEISKVDNLNDWN